MWSGNAVDDFQTGDAGVTHFAVFDSTTDSVGPGQSQFLDHDMFCPGVSMLANGDVVISAGSAGGDGAGSTTTWDFSAGAFVQGPKLNIRRGYNSALTLANGNVRCSIIDAYPMHCCSPQTITIKTNSYFWSAPTLSRTMCENNLCAERSAPVRKAK